jgi:PAS domain S-box-containing protein
MNEEEQKKRIAELERRIALLEGAAQQTTRIREQWHSSIQQLSQAKAKLQESETKYRLLHSNAFDAIILADKNGTILEANPAAGRIFGWDPKAMAGLNIEQMMPGNYRNRHHAGLSRHLAGGEANAMGRITEMEALRRNGEVFPIEMMLDKLPIDGEIIFTATIRDITERKRSENALKRLNEKLEEKVLERTRELEEASQTLRVQQERLQAMIDNTIVGIGSMDTEGRYKQVNDAFAQFLGYAPDELIGKNHLDVTHPEDVDTCRDCLRKLVSDDIHHYRLEKRFIHKSGETVWGDVSISATRDASGKPVEIIDVITDITERKKAEARLHKLSRAVSQADEGVVIADSDGSIEYINSAFTRITGYTPADILGQPLSTLENDQRDEALHHNIGHTLQQGQPWEGRLVIRHKGGSEFPLHLTASPIFNDAGEITNYVGIGQDLTDYEELEERFHQAQKMESLGTLAGGIAHEFNNMLAGITGNLHLAMMRVKEMPEVEKQLQNAQRISFRAADMIRQLLAFAHRDIVQMQSFDLIAFVDEAFRLHRVSIPKQIKCRTQFCDESLMVRGDEAQLHQILTNLLNNARDALKDNDHPEITVSLSRFEADDAFRKKHADLKKGLFACLSVHDNGQGIPKSQIQDIFEPFFTTKSVGEGTGLGLSMVHGAVTMHGGTIEVESHEGKGSTFRIYLPLESSEPTADAGKSTATLHGEGEAILLADDDPTVLKTGEQVLHSLGYEVLTAKDGKQALALFEKERENIRLVMLDVVMPEVDGVEAARHIRELSPEVGIIMTTGHDKQQVTDQIRGMERIVILTKPYMVDQISQHIRQLIQP